MIVASLQDVWDCPDLRVADSRVVSSRILRAARQVLVPRSASSDALSVLGIDPVEGESGFVLLDVKERRAKPFERPNLLKQPRFVTEHLEIGEEVIVTEAPLDFDWPVALLTCRLSDEASDARPMRWGDVLELFALLQ